MLKSILFLSAFLITASASAAGSITCVGKINSKGQITQPHYPKTSVDIKVISSFGSGKTCSRNQENLRDAQVKVIVEGVTSKEFKTIRSLSVKGSRKGSALYN